MAKSSSTGVFAPGPRFDPDDPHDAALLAAVRPPGWVAPEPRGRYHLVVVGGGSAGLVAAAIAAGLGAKVALVERHLLGGDCLNSGCVPSKALLAAAASWRAARRSAEDFGGPAVAGPGDFAVAMARLRRLRAEIAPHDGAERFQSLGVDVYFGQGRFVAGDALEVGGRRLLFRKAAIATGGRPAVPDIPGLADVPFLTSESLFGLKELPARLAILGGGAIGCEMAQAFARFGSEVHLLEAAPRLLPQGDAEAAAALARVLAAEGVRLHLGASLLRVEERGRGVALFLHGAAELVADALLVATGRRPNVAGLGLEAAGVRYDAGGVEVDDGLLTSNPRIYALGDVASRLQLTHQADAQARMLIGNAFFFGRGKKSRLILPSAVYTSPEIAQVGLTEEEARRRGVRCELVRVELEAVDRAILAGEGEGFLKLLVEPRRGRLLGATLVAENAGELIGYAVLAMSQGLGLAAFGETVLPYPTRAEVFRRAADQWRRRRLTPRIRSFFETYFRLRG